MDLSNTAWPQKGFINNLSGNAFATASRIRPIIIITFGTTNVVLQNGITFGIGIIVGSRDRDIVTEVLSQDIVTFTQTNGNRPQNIVSHLVPDQSDNVIIDAGTNHSVIIEQ